MNNQKGNLYLIIAIIIGAVAIGAVGFTSWKYFGEISELEQLKEKETQPVYLPKKEKTVPQVEQEEIIPSKKVDETSSIKILSPNGGEKWKIGNSYLVRWNSVGSIPQVKIYLVPVNSNAGIRYISYGPIANTDSYTYAIPYCGPGYECSSNFEIPKGEYYIRITDSKSVVSDQSDASFSIISD